MNIALCYESVLPARGGCETYIADLARRLVADGHEVHLYAWRWDAAALPEAVTLHALPRPRGPRFLRPWRFSAACAAALRQAGHDVSVGFNKTWGPDVLYPQGGLYAAAADYNLRKYRSSLVRGCMRLTKALDLAHWSFSRLDHRLYLGVDRPLVVVNSHMVQAHFQHYHGIAPESLRLVRSAIDPQRFGGHDRAGHRQRWRQRWAIQPQESVALFVAMNYRLKGLVPLLHAVRRLRGGPLRLVVVGKARTGAYARQARRLGIESQVIFAGPCRDMKACYFASDFLVHPTFYDPCSLVVLEALACGLPVITTRYNGASELLNAPDDGYVIADPHDHALLAGCMRRLLDPDRRSACAAAVRRTAARWTFEDHYQQLLQVFVEAAARKRGGAPGGLPARLKTEDRGSRIGDSADRVRPRLSLPDPQAATFAPRSSIPPPDRGGA